MRIAFLCKRRYMGKDVIADRYGRLYEIPRQLALYGHEVRGYCLDYHGAGRGAWSHGAAPGTLTWESVSVSLLRTPALAASPSRLLRRIRGYKPDVLIGASDIPHAVLAEWLSRKLQRPCVVDLYDNFESFGQARIPFFKTLLARAVQRADLVTAVTEPLISKAVNSYKRTGETLLLPNAVDPSMFYPGERASARMRLKLPAESILIGTAGYLARMKGLAPLYAAWPQIERSLPDAHLVLAGPIDSRMPPPTGPRVHYLGKLPSERVATLFNALDLGVITLLDDDFGRFCSPQKAYEMLACGLPFVSAAVGSMTRLLRDSPARLYRPDDADDLARTIVDQLASPVPMHVSAADWASRVSKLNHALQSLQRSRL